MINVKKTTQSATCYHCGENVESTAIQFDDKAFCCTGCKTVYQVLSQNGLCDYYALNETPGLQQRIPVRAEKFAFLEDTTIVQQLIRFRENEQVQVVFYLPQIHCSSCLWLLENLHQLHNGISSSRVDFAHKEVTINFNEKQIGLKKIAELLTEVGYEPHISLNELQKKPKNYYNRTRIYKLGVAGFCLGNIMLLSFPEYLSVVDNPEQVKLMPWFRYLNLLLALPVFFFSASEFFVQGFKGLRKGFLNIDAPIALAILITFSRSVFEVVSSTGGGYFDSMTGIVFLMLVGRILQDKTQQSLTFDRDYTSYFPIAVNKIVDGEEIPTPLPALRQGDTIAIHHQEIIPADGMLITGHGSIDYSFVTGESVPVSKNISELVYAGGRQVGGKIEILLVKDVSQSYLTGLWNKASMVKTDQDQQSFLHPLARYFTVVLFSLTIIAAFYWWVIDPALVWPVVTAMLIVACPCSLLLSATFTNGHVVRAFDRAGLYLRNYAILEKLLPVTHVVFDKTGTITTNGDFKITYSGSVLTDEIKKLLASVASQSHHPLSKAICGWLRQKNVYEVDHFKEIQGAGTEAWLQERHIKIGSPAFVWGHNDLHLKGSVVAFKMEGDVQGIFVLRNHYRPQIRDTFKKISNRFQVSVISGDNDSEAPILRKLIGNRAVLKFNQSPHDKLLYVQQLQASGAKVLMVGDGLNDAAALATSEVGIAVTDNVNNFSPACDAILDAQKLHRLHAYLTMASKGRSVILFSFFISILYNIVGLSFAASGALTPLVAAILMPASSISIMLVAWLGVMLWSSILLRNKKVVSKK